uniref:Insulin-like peptide 4 n=1 Tax=Laodelphax striatellus TaxID=195883 RepID=A0A345BEE2_LAOST|nr:insulin-like peptide 4 [Laodelphax striatellus]
MDSWLLLLSAAVALSCLLPTAVHSFPQEYRKCGDGLANMLALVCRGRGYNAFFPQNDNVAGRNRRGIGIVDECCRSSCSLNTVLQYCGPLTSTETPPNSVIKKRSDSDWVLETNSEGTEIQKALKC